tara:strand:+ start:442 stop:1182 length:741 start_codon:yes stop_codon:yes gene_type:complete
MKYIKDLENLSEKRVLLRLDLNVPIKKGIITDQTRIDKILPVINFLIKKKSKILIISHIGRPKGKINKDLSLKPICENLEKKIDQKVSLIKDDILRLKREDLFKNSKEQIIFLENIRFYLEEEKNDANFSKHLSKLVDIFVNDAFSCSHRAHASISKITEFLPSYAGLQLETEINALKKITPPIHSFILEELKRVSLNNNLFFGVDGILTLSNLFDIVPVLSSAARIPFPSFSNSNAILFNSDILI